MSAASAAADDVHVRFRRAAIRAVLADRLQTVETPSLTWEDVRAERMAGPAGNRGLAAHGGRRGDDRKQRLNTQDKPGHAVEDAYAGAYNAAVDAMGDAAASGGSVKAVLEAFDWLYGSDGGCPTLGARRFSLPPFTEVLEATQDCFRLQYGASAWPETGCCPPEVDEREACEPPNFVQLIFARLWVQDRHLVPGDKESPVQERVPTDVDRNLVAAATWLLVEHFDIVGWAACEVNAWSPELYGLDVRGLLAWLLTPGADGRFPWYIWWVDNATPATATEWAMVMNADPPHGSYDGSIGVVIPIEHGYWAGRIADWTAGGGRALCATVQLASELLHELVHVLGDRYFDGNEPRSPGEYNWMGASHEDKDLVPEPCWDEARMIQTMFLWAMARRLPCLTSSSKWSALQPNDCRCIASDRYFAYSVSTQQQIRAEGADPC